jgi:hypothetical protein
MSARVTASHWTNVPTGNASNGEIHWVQIDIDDDDHNHLTSLGAREIGHCVGVGKATRNA